MGFSQTIISLDEDNKISNSELFLHTNEEHFHKDLFKCLINDPFFTFGKIGEIKETVEKLEFENLKEYNLFGVKLLCFRFLG